MQRGVGARRVALVDEPRLGERGPERHRGRQVGSLPFAVAEERAVQAAGEVVKQLGEVERVELERGRELLAQLVYAVDVLQKDGRELLLQ